MDIRDKKDVGNKSIIDIPIIIDIEKDKLTIIKLLICFWGILNRIIKLPNKVDIPAIKDNINAFIIFISITNK